MSKISGLIPKNGRVAEPGLRSVTPGKGVIKIPPVSVCHHVSTIGHFSFPTYLYYHIPASGFIGAPTVPNILKESLFVFFSGSSPSFINALIAVGAV